MRVGRLIALATTVFGNRKPGRAFEAGRMGGHLPTIEIYRRVLDAVVNQRRSTVIIATGQKNGILQKLTKTAKVRSETFPLCSLRSLVCSIIRFLRATGIIPRKT